MKRKRVGTGSRVKKKQDTRRNCVLDDAWKDIYLCGTELDNYDKVFDTKWDFSHFISQLENGSIKGTSRYAYVFGGTEPQLNSQTNEILYIPVLIAVVGNIEPPNQLGVMSIQKEEEEIVSFNEMKFTWCPYFTEREKHRLDFSTKSASIFFLHCNLRTSALKNMDEKKKIEYSYLLPYIFRPSKLLEDEDDDTSVTKFREVNGRMVTFTVDFKSDKKEKTRVLNDIIVDYSFPVEQREDVKKVMKEILENAKQEYEEKKLGKQKVYDEMNAKQRMNMEALRYVKFYPKNCNEKGREMDLDEYRVSFINRYFGKADEVNPPVVKRVFSWGSKK